MRWGGRRALLSIKSVILPHGRSLRHIRWTHTEQQGPREAGRIEPRWSISLWTGTEYPNYYSCEEKLLFESDSIGWHGPRRGQDWPWKHSRKKRQKNTKTTECVCVYISSTERQTHTHTQFQFKMLEYQQWWLQSKHLNIRVSSSNTFWLK